MADKWMQSAVKPSHKGTFTKKATAQGESVHEYAEKEKGAGGTLGKEANLALTFEHASSRRYGQKKEPPVKPAPKPKRYGA